MIWFKLAYKEIRNNPRFSLFFILNLSLGLVGFIALNSFQVSISRHISNQSRAILSADIDIRSNDELTASDLAILENEIGTITAKTKRIDFLSMIAAKTDSRLVQILAVDQGYPLYGEIKLGSQQTASPKNMEEQLIDSASIWVQPEILTALDSKLGDTVSIGVKTFKISDTIVDTSTGFALSGGFAYRIFMGLEQAKKTGLIDKGSRRYHHYLYSIPATVDVELLAERLKRTASQHFGGNSRISIQTHNNAGRRLTRFHGYVSDYLGLVSLVALFLAGVGTAYLFRSYLGANLKDIAILMMLGAEKKKTYFFLLIQLAALGAVSALFAFLLSFLFLPLLTSLMIDFLPKGFTTVFSWQSVFLAFLMGVMGSILFCLPILKKIHNLKPMIVFNEDQRSSTTRKFDPINLISYAPLLVTFWLLSVWQSNSWIIGSVFIASLIGSFIVLGIIGWALIIAANKISPESHLVIKLAFRNLYRNKIAVISSFLAIGLGSLLINLIPQIDYGLQQEIQHPQSTHLPSFFLFDIQPDQVSPLESLLADYDYKMDNVSPWIEARLIHINDVELQRTDQVEEEGSQEQRRARHSRRRTQNLSYRLNLYDSENIVKGKIFSGTYNPESGLLPEISLDFRYSDSLNTSVGDTLTFDVQGIPVQGRIVNVRRIQWQTMQPNFYVLFQPGVLEDAPSTFLGTIYKVKEEDRVMLQNKIVSQFPNVSMVDITLAVNKAFEITGQISWAIQVMAFSAIFVGMIVVYSISRYNSQTRMKEINLLKVLGASFNNIKQIILLEFYMFGLTASFFGSLLSLVASRILSYLIFDSIWAVSWQIAIITILSVTFLTMLSAYMGTRKVLLQKPVFLLQAL